MNISEFYATPNLVACQYIDIEIRKRLDEMIGVWFNRSNLAEAQERALRVARCEFNAYEEWLCQQAQVDPASYLFDEDVPY